MYACAGQRERGVLNKTSRTMSPSTAIPCTPATFSKVLNSDTASPLSRIPFNSVPPQH